MTRTGASLILGILGIVLIVPTAGAKVSPEETARLGKDLTQMGAIRAGNVEGTIPAWEGGITQPPPGYKPGMHHPDPFADDQPRFTITAANVDQYREKLSPGQIAMFKRYPKTWKMTVYPTRRSASYPQVVYDAIIANATTAELVAGGNGVVDAIRGVPFPIPKAGVEVIWNHMLRYKGRSVQSTSGQVSPTASGAYTFVLTERKAIFPYYWQDTTFEDIKKHYVYLLFNILSPARLAGFIGLGYDAINQVEYPRKSWTYNTGQRRVRRAPNVIYDNPASGTDGQRISDQEDMWNGPVDRYDWTLVGRKEVYVPYNSYKVHSDKLTYEEIIKPGHINPDVLRYELHRAWVVEAKLKEGTSHIFSRRTFYIDEDSWQILAVDQYDKRGELWRVSEAHVINYYEVPLLSTTLQVHYDLQNGRYNVLGLNNRHPIERWNVELGIKQFQPEALRRSGRR